MLPALMGQPEHVGIPLGLLPTGHGRWITRGLLALQGALTMDNQLSFFWPEPQMSAAHPQKRGYTIPIYRVALVRDAQLPATSLAIRSASQAADIVRDYLDGVDREHFVILMLNRKNRVIGLHTVSIGTLTASLAHPREVLCAV
jgi:hypothetical protein